MRLPDGRLQLITVAQPKTTAVTPTAAPTLLPSMPAVSLSSVPQTPTVVQSVAHPTIKPLQSTTIMNTIGTAQFGTPASILPICSSGKVMMLTNLF